MMYQIYRNGRPYGRPSTSKEFLEYGMSKLKPIHMNDIWEIKEITENENTVSEN